MRFTNVEIMDINSFMSLRAAIIIADLCETYCHSVHYHGQMFQNLSKSDRICLSMGKI